MRPVHVHSDAEADLLAIAEYLSDFSEQAAERFIAHFESVLEQLRAFPEIGQASGASSSTRVLRRDVYRFLYEVLDEALVLRRILDGRGQRELP